MTIDDVRAYLRQFNAEHRVMEFDVSSATVELAAQALHCEGARIAKTLSFMVGERPVFIVMAGDARVDNPKFKHLFGCKARMMDAVTLEHLTGLHFGGVCPFGNPEGVKTYLDVSLQRFDTVFPAAGSSNSAIEPTCEELERYSHSLAWVDICKAWQEE